MTSSALNNSSPVYGERMIKDPKRYREHTEREWIVFLRGLTYEESLRMVEALLSCRLLEQVQLRDEDRPLALRYLLHGRSG